MESSQGKFGKPGDYDKTVNKLAKIWEHMVRTLSADERWTVSMKKFVRALQFNFAILEVVHERQTPVKMILLTLREFTHSTPQRHGIA